MTLNNKDRALLVKLFRMVVLFSYSERIPAYKIIKKMSFKDEFKNTISKFEETEEWVLFQTQEGGVP